MFPRSLFNAHLPSARAWLVCQMMSLGVLPSLNSPGSCYSVGLCLQRIFFTPFSCLLYLEFSPSLDSSQIKAEIGFLQVTGKLNPRVFTEMVMVVSLEWQQSACEIVLLVSFC